MTSERSQDRVGQFMLLLLVASVLFIFFTELYSDEPSRGVYIIAALSLITGLLAVVNVEQLKHRNVHAQRARVAEYNSMLMRKRADRLDDENRRLFNARMAHVPVEVMVRTLASLGGGPIRLRNVTPDSEWYRVATSPEFRHLFHKDYLRKVESTVRSEESAQ